MADDFAPFVDMIPDGAVPMYGLLLVAYLDGEDGVVYDEYRHVGAMTTRDALGTLEATKFRISCDQWNLMRDED